MQTLEHFVFQDEQVVQAAVEVGVGEQRHEEPRLKAVGVAAQRLFEAGAHGGKQFESPCGELLFGQVDDAVDPAHQVAVRLRVGNERLGARRGHVALGVLGDLFVQELPRRRREVGMRHRLEANCPGKRFYFPEHAVCGAMKMATLESIASALERMEPQVVLPEEVMGRARRPVERMIGLS